MGQITSFSISKKVGYLSKKVGGYLSKGKVSGVWIPGSDPNFNESRFVLENDDGFVLENDDGFLVVGGEV